MFLDFKKLPVLAWIILVLFFGTGVLIGWQWRVFYNANQPSRLIEIRENDNKYRYINPLLLVDAPKEAPEYGTLKKNLTNTINQFLSQGAASSISVYFRDVNSGKWTGIDEDDAYDPSSMLKVAVMMGYLKAAEDNPSILLKKLAYVTHVDPGQNYKPEHPLASGVYTARQLIEAMITDSDNDALNALYNNDRDDFVDVLKSLDIPPPATINTLDFMSPKIYSSLFRTLYSSTYLDREVSEQALQLLTYTTFDKGLVAGLPAGTIVAHKFGEHTNAVNNQVQSKQLHDCGIVYAPKNPYLLCVMTKGTDFDTLANIISTISNITYKNITGK